MNALNPPSCPRCAVVDLGSNSVRLVVFEGQGRNPVAIFNEKAVLRLGRGLQQTGRLHEDGVSQALTVMVRYAALARAMGASPFEVLATAAVRDAENGPAFVAALQAGIPDIAIRVLSGEQEATFSAQGLLCGIPGADGILADIGGGSLEVVRLEGGALRAARTLPLGVLRRRCRSCPKARDATCIWSAAPGARWPGYTWSRPPIRSPSFTTTRCCARRRATSPA